MSRIALLGTGLIGASIGAGLRRHGHEVVGWDPDQDASGQAKEIDALDAVAPDPESALTGAEVVFLAGPVGAIIDTLPELATDALVTDVAGVKVPVVEAASGSIRFVGGHPMAGRESSGPGAASPAMFQGATWILTTDGAADEDLIFLETMVGELGAVPVRMAAREHDAAVAAVSHVPQVVASALVNLVGKDGVALSVAAGGFRDLTRIALSEPGWWTDILAANRDEVAALVRRLGSDLASWADEIEGDRRQQISGLLGSARETRRSLTAPVAAVRVLLEDRPGEIARVGHALAETGVDVRDLQLRHATRGGGGVLTLSVRPGQEQMLEMALTQEGFRLVD